MDALKEACEGKLPEHLLYLAVYTVVVVVVLEGLEMQPFLLNFVIQCFRSYLKYK